MRLKIKKCSFQTRKGENQRMSSLQTVANEDLLRDAVGRRPDGGDHSRIGNWKEHRHWLKNQPLNYWESL